MKTKQEVQAHTLERDYCSCMSMWIARGNIASYRDTRIDYLLSKASSRLYIIRICKYYAYSIENLDLLFQSLILSVFTYAIEVWGCALYSKYLSRIDKLFARCYKLGYCLKQYSILDIRRNRDMKLWPSISSTNTALSVFLPPPRTRQMRTRSHYYILPNVRTSRFQLRKHSARACPI